MQELGYRLYTAAFKAQCSRGSQKRLAYLILTPRQSLATPVSLQRGAPLVVRKPDRLVV